MTDAFDRLVPDTRAFLCELEGNNARDWFLANKPRYESQLKKPAEALLDLLSADLQKLTGHPVKPKLFRLNRDVRFSKDKTPYHLHLHLLWTTDGGGRQPIGWFLGISQSYISVGAGLMGFDKETLTAWRDAVAGTNGPEFEEEMAALMSKGFRIGEPELKRVPAPFAKDHPQAEQLKRKSLTAWMDFEENDFRDPQNAALTTFRQLLPLTQKLQSVL